jgi:hypothetical protein
MFNEFLMEMEEKERKTSTEYMYIYVYIYIYSQVLLFLCCTYVYTDTATQVANCCVKDNVYTLQHCKTVTYVQRESDTKGHVFLSLQ